MADAEKINVDLDDDVEKDAEPKKGLPFKKYGIYAGIVIVMMAAAYFVTLKVVKPMFAGDGAAVEEKAAAEPEAGKKSEEGGHKTASKHGSEEESVDNIFLIEGLIVNPAGTGGRRFLSTSIGFEPATSEASGLLEQRKAIIRDALITILSSQSIPELSDFKQREKLRQLIRLRVDKLLGSKQIAGVYFTEFVLQ